MDEQDVETLWSPRATASYLVVEEKTLANWRALRKGPAYLKVVGRVRYRPQDVRDWALQQARGQSAVSA